MLPGILDGGGSTGVHQREISSFIFPHEGGDPPQSTSCSGVFPGLHPRAGLLLAGAGAEEADIVETSVLVTNTGWLCTDFTHQI